MSYNIFDKQFLDCRYDSRDKGRTSDTDTRTAGQIDRDRILYCGHFLRLAEVTQTISPVHGYVFHNRLSHSLKVAQVSRRLCERLKVRYKDDSKLGPIVATLDADVCEAVGLAHDLGHPPFGHVVETELMQTLTSDRNRRLDPSDTDSAPYWLEDGFEGNAQSFRIVCRLAGTHLPGIGDSDVLGLNLTRQTLNGILKYPHLHSKDIKDGKKWGAYREDEAFFNFAREGLGDSRRKSLEAEIMDWADDVTFAVHDLLDFYASGSIPLFFFQNPLGKAKATGADGLKCHTEREKFIVDAVKDKHNADLVEDAKTLDGSPGLTDEAYLDRVLEGIFKGPPRKFGSRYTGANGQRRNVGETTFELIEECLEAFQLIYDANQQDGLGEWRIKKDLRKAVEVDLLKQFTWHYIIRGQGLQYDQIGQKVAASTVFNEHIDAAKRGKDAHVFPYHVREQLEAATSKEKTRIVVDYVASMSEPELMRIYKQLISADGYGR